MERVGTREKRVLRGLEQIREEKVEIVRMIDKRKYGEWGQIKIRKYKVKIVRMREETAQGGFEQKEI